jgi:hypothetical protein
MKKGYHILFSYSQSEDTLAYHVWNVKDMNDPDVGPIVINKIHLKNKGEPRSLAQAIGETVLKYRPVSVSYVI